MARLPRPVGIAGGKNVSYRGNEKSDATYYDIYYDCSNDNTGNGKSHEYNVIMNALNASTSFLTCKIYNFS